MEDIGGVLSKPVALGVMQAGAPVHVLASDFPAVTSCKLADSLAGGM